MRWIQQRCDGCARTAAELHGAGLLHRGTDGKLHGWRRRGGRWLCAECAARRASTSTGEQDQRAGWLGAVVGWCVRILKAG